MTDKTESRKREIEKAIREINRAQNKLVNVHLMLLKLLLWDEIKEVKKATAHIEVATKLLKEKS